MEALSILNQHMTMPGNMWVFLIANTSYKNCFQYACVPLIELINEYLLSLAINFSTVPVNLLLSFLVASVTYSNLCIAKFIVEYTWCYSYTDLAKIHYLHLMQNHH